MSRPVGIGVVPAIERIKSKIVKIDNGCWIYPAKNGNGYGRIYENGKQKYTHRIVYEHFVGPILNKLDIDHLCRNRACVNPNHLEMVERKENVKRGLRGKMITHCPSGHEYNQQNTLFKNTGHRRCKACHAAREKNAKRWRKNEKEV